MEQETRTEGILVVDDNFEIREIIQILLQAEGFATAEAKNGMEALNLIEKQSFDLIILDIMMPGLNGYQTCVEIRKASNAPILFLSARGQESDKTLGFSSGGDDYLVKPFSYSELVSRAKALIRRYQVYQGKGNMGSQWSKKEQSEEKQKDKGRFIFQNLEIDSDKETVYKKGERLELTNTEYAILLLLVINRHQIFSAERLYECIWGEQYYYGANNTIMVHIRNLRKKIEKDPKNPELLKTIWGRGYRCD